MRNALAALGRVLITLGILILAFVAYQLWGTGVYTARAQSTLENQFEEALEQGSHPTGRPPEGEAVANIQIPKIGVDWMVVEGTSTADLQKGPGRYADTPLPGELGNAAIAGHRTTYGQPFHRLDELTVGDEIVVTTFNGTFRYLVDEQPFVVRPSQVEVLLPRGFPAEPEIAQLTLTTCHPKYSASQRLIVKAVLDEDTSDAPTTPAVEFTGDVGIADGLTGDGSASGPMIAWGFLLALVGGAWWALFHRYPRWTTWVVGVVPFVVVLFFFYTYLERFLGPATVPFG